VVIMAAPDFDMQFDVEVDEVQEQKEKDTLLTLRAGHSRRSVDLKKVYWNPLPGTREEAEQISKLFGKGKVQMYVGNQAMEEVFKGLQSPRICHIATHGFFLEDVDRSAWYETKDRFRVSSLEEGLSQALPEQLENPLLRSGLALAGANRLGEQQLPEDADDGILTAFEISGMNFWGTDLVVLSACETGVGEVRRGEGVFGLRRAFQLAGARTVIMSLWEVPDVETMELMVDFYQRLQAGEGKARALRNAQLAMIKQLRARHGAAHPYFWSAFVCVGEP